ncbi:hypothetical protein L2E82_05796 [Cichorium intybus]|uniref:Uncharacterized protein n=1 Tax=Cichorium intybus TaxID=13427 RepID=A0ACB9H9S8_CICIN|nr:hypothetical protein L2E82_05796 [Cichorium intybus]
MHLSFFLKVKCEDLVKKFNNLKERKNELRSLILKGLEDEPQDNNLLSLLIEFDYEFGAPTRDDDEEVETHVQSARRDDVMQSPVPFDLSPTLLEEFSSLSDKSLKDLININYPLFKRGIEEDMKHDVEIQDFQKVDLVFFPIHQSGHYYLIVFDLRKPAFILIDNIKRRNNSTNHYRWNPKTPIWDMLESTLTYQYKKYAEAIKQTTAKPVAS